jgi:hypothetical protein
MTPDKPWHAQVYKTGGYWRWDVRSPGLRSTGERETWREAYDTAVAELGLMRAAATGEVTPRGLRGPGVLVRHLQGDR